MAIVCNMLIHVKTMQDIEFEALSLILITMSCIVHELCTAVATQSSWIPLLYFGSA